MLVAPINPVTKRKNEFTLKNMSRAALPEQYRAREANGSTPQRLETLTTVFRVTMLVCRRKRAFKTMTEAKFNWK